jgi:hypothetical protein
MRNALEAFIHDANKAGLRSRGTAVWPGKTPAFKGQVQSRLVQKRSAGLA